MTSHRAPVRIRSTCATRSDRPRSGRRVVPVALASLVMATAAGCCGCGGNSPTFDWFGWGTPRSVPQPAPSPRPPTSPPPTSRSTTAPSSNARVEPRTAVRASLRADGWHQVSGASPATGAGPWSASYCGDGSDPSRTGAGRDGEPVADPCLELIGRPAPLDAVRAAYAAEGFTTAAVRVDGRRGYAVTGSSTEPAIVVVEVDDVVLELRSDDVGTDPLLALADDLVPSDA